MEQNLPSKENWEVKKKLKLKKKKKKKKKAILKG
jgi:hypothetical protein